MEGRIGVVRACQGEWQESHQRSEVRKHLVLKLGGGKQAKRVAELLDCLSKGLGVVVDSGSSKGCCSWTVCDGE